MMAEEKNKVQEGEIDLLELVLALWKSRWFIIKVTGFFSILGLVIAFTSPVEYQSSCKLLPESDKEKMSSLGGLVGLAGLAGVDLGSMSNSNTLTPQLYPEIVNSLPFILEVINDSIYFEKQQLTTTPLYYFKEIANPSALQFIINYTVGLPGQIKKMFSGDNEILPSDSTYLRISSEDWKLIESFKERIIVNIDNDTGIIEILVKMPDPYAASQVTKVIELMITKSVTDYQTEKSLRNLEFIKKTYHEAKVNFERIQLELARAQDRNKYLTSASAEIELKKIEYEYDIAFTVYKGLSSQVEQAKIQLKEETPVFTILEPVRIPNKNIEPRKTLICLASIILGFLTGIAIVYGKSVILPLIKTL